MSPLDLGSSAPTHLLARLRAAHDEIVFRLNTLAHVFDTGGPADSDYVAARWHLTKASRARWLLLSGEIFPLLKERGAWSDAVAALFDDGAVQQDTSIRHVARWPLRAAIADWDDYRAASDLIRAGMRKRIDHEARVLYPVLEALAEQG